MVKPLASELSPKDAARVEAEQKSNEQQVIDFIMRESAHKTALGQTRPRETPPATPLSPEQRLHRAKIAETDPLRYLTVARPQDLERRGIDGQAVYWKLHNYLEQHTATVHRYTNSLYFEGLDSHDVFALFDQLLRLRVDDSGSEEDEDHFTSLQKKNTIQDMLALFETHYNDEYDRFAEVHPTDDFDYWRILECLGIHPDIAPLTADGERKVRVAASKNWELIDLEVALARAENPEQALAIIIRFFTDFSLDTPAQRNNAISAIATMRTMIGLIPFQGQSIRFTEKIHDFLAHKIEAIRQREVLENKSNLSDVDPKIAFGEYGWVAVATVQNALYPKNAYAEHELFSSALPSALSAIFGTPSLELSREQKVASINEMIRLIETTQTLSSSTKERALTIVSRDYRVIRLLRTLSTFRK